MKGLIIRVLTVLSLGVGVSANAQPVPKTVIAEHFTNTYCSVCASRNPGFYANLWAQPQVLHIAYHPSSPYAACPLSMHNVPENNARTNYYGVFGSTPRLAIQGAPLSSSANYSDPAIFTSVAGQTTAFSMKVAVMPFGTDSVTTTITIKKEDASGLSSLSLYGALVEDTLFFAAANGETRSYDVFRKAIYGTTSLTITAPSGVGDSVVYMQKTALNSTWNKSRIYAIAMLQDAGKNMVQAAKSANLAASAGMEVVLVGKGLVVYPNPVTTFLKVSGELSYPCNFSVFNITGQRVLESVLDNPSAVIDVSRYTTGEYILVLNGCAGSAIQFTRK